MATRQMERKMDQRRFHNNHRRRHTPDPAIAQLDGWLVRFMRVLHSTLKVW